MASPVEFNEMNDNLGKPPDMTDNQVLSLPIARILTQIPGESPSSKPQSVLAFTSFWKFDPEELEAINKSGGAYVKIIGVTTYPFSVSGFSPTEQGDYLLNEAQLKSLKQQKL
jgi:hypothetical protein